LPITFVVARESILVGPWAIEKGGGLIRYKVLKTTSATSSPPLFH